MESKHVIQSNNKLIYTLCVNLVYIHLIKVGNDLIENPQTLSALVVDSKFSVELMEVWD